MAPCLICGSHPAQCPMCGNREPRDPEAGLWWWVRGCLFCPAMVCGSVVDRRPGEGTSDSCWVRHMQTKHPEKLRAAPCEVGGLVDAGPTG